MDWVTTYIDVTTYLPVTDRFILNETDPFVAVKEKTLNNNAFRIKPDEDFEERKLNVTEWLPIS